MFSWKKVFPFVVILESLVILEAYKGSEFVNNKHESKPEQAVIYSSQESKHFEPNHPATSNVPNEEMEYMFRVYATNCSCPQKKKQVDVADKLAKNREHLPFGVPYSREDNVTLRLLYNEDYVTAFDLKYRIPMWTSYTIHGKDSDFSNKDVCWTGDARIAFSDTAQCGDYDTYIVKRNDILQRPVFPLDFSNPYNEDQVSYITNSIPKSVNHTKFAEDKVYQILNTWAQEETQLNVIMGPAFDLDGNGTRPFIGTIMRTHAIHGPLIVPTHIFAIATWCSNKNISISECDSANLSAHGFLIPNKPFPIEYTMNENILQNGTTRIADIEKLTALTFYTGLPISDAVRLRTTSSERITSNSN